MYLVNWLLTLLEKVRKFVVIAYRTDISNVYRIKSRKE